MRLEETQEVHCLVYELLCTKSMAKAGPKATELAQLNRIRLDQLLRATCLGNRRQLLQNVVHTGPIFRLLYPTLVDEAPQIVLHENAVRIVRPIRSLPCHDSSLQLEAQLGGRIRYIESIQLSQRQYD